MKFIQHEGHVLQPDTMMPPEVQSITDPDIWKVSIHRSKTGTFLKYNHSPVIFLCSVLIYKNLAA